MISAAIRLRRERVLVETLAAKRERLGYRVAHLAVEHRGPRNFDVLGTASQVSCLSLFTCIT